MVKLDLGVDDEAAANEVLPKMSAAEVQMATYKIPAADAANEAAGYCS